MAYLSADEYRIIVQQAPIMIWRSDMSAGCDYFNQLWLSFTGATLEHELGNGWADGVHPEDFDRCLNIYLTAFAARERFTMEYRLRRADGDYRWILDEGGPFFDAEGAFAGFIGSCIDITERIEAQNLKAELDEAEMRRLRGLLPICAECKKIRDDKGYWREVEEYVRDHSEVEFSHSLCPECLQAALKEMDE
jgi:PAS domain S-box-containing protein